MSTNLPPRAVTILACRLTERDHSLLEALLTHRVLTTRQVGALFFTGPEARNARRRLLYLHGLRILDRFRPAVAIGSAPTHWILAPAGADVVAHRRNTTVNGLGYSHEAAVGTAVSKRLDHMVGLAGCYVALTCAARTTPGAVLERWRGEVECARRWGRYIRPDAYFRWTENGTTVDAFVEYDNGTEPLARIEQKMAGYAGLAVETELPSRILFIVPGHKREANMARKLAARPDPMVPVHLTTHALLEVPGPAGAIWRSVHHDTRRRLAKLAA